MPKLVKVTLNPNDMGINQILSNGNLTSTITATSNIRATHGKSKGKWYWEITFNVLNAFVIGIANKNYPINSNNVNGNGEALNIRAYYNGLKYPENTSYGTSALQGDVIGVALDLDNGTLEFYKNGISQGISHTNLSALGEVFPFIRSANSNSKTFTVNFGATNFNYPIPSGFSAYVYYPYSNIILKNSNTSKIYSLDNKTLIHLPSSSQNNIISYGIESGKEIKLDEDFDKMKYVQDTSEVLGEGKIFTHAVDMSNTKINKIIL